MGRCAGVRGPVGGAGGGSAADAAAPLPLRSGRAHRGRGADRGARDRDRTGLRSGRADPARGPAVDRAHGRPRSAYRYRHDRVGDPHRRRDRRRHRGSVMEAALIVVIVLIVLAVIVVAKSVILVPQAEAAVIERLGRYARTVTGQLTVIVPFVDRVRERVDLRERVVSFPPQAVITEDNLTLAIDTVVYFQVTNPQAVVYEINNYIVGVEQLTTTTLRNVVGGMTLEETLTSREPINNQLRGVLDEATGRWGLRVARVELKSIDPPPSIQESMEKQMKADRENRAMILTAEGRRESDITTAEGTKQAQILAAEGAKQAAILAAEAERQSAILSAEGERAASYLRAQGEAKSIEKRFAAIKRAKPTPELLAYQYLETLPEMGRGEGNTMWVVPSEFGEALQGFARKFGEMEQDGSLRY